MQLCFIRHGESEANRLGQWQGSTNSPLSTVGQSQAQQLARRLGEQEFDLVLSSDLDRAADTAAGLGTVELAPEWREANLGRWEGKSRTEVKARWSELLATLASDQTTQMGETGESPQEFTHRIEAALSQLCRRVDSGDRVAVVTHGGVIDVVMSQFLGRVRPRTYPLVKNTSLTVIGGVPDHLMLHRFNDATHLDSHPVHPDWSHTVPFIRHGVTLANKQNRIQGRSCWGLDKEGQQQAQALSDWLGPTERVISSPIDRAHQTATVVANGSRPEVSAQLAEMSFGDWEGLAMDQVVERDPDLAHRIYRQGQDLPRGHTGENYQAVIDRMTGFMDGFQPIPTQSTAVVSHGGTIRALVAAVTQNGVDTVNRLLTPENTALTHFAFSERGPRLVDYSLTPHFRSPL